MAGVAAGTSIFTGLFYKIYPHSGLMSLPHLLWTMYWSIAFYQMWRLKIALDQETRDKKIDPMVKKIDDIKTEFEEKVDEIDRKVDVEFNQISKQLEVKFDELNMKFDEMSKKIDEIEKKLWKAQESLEMRMISMQKCLDEILIAVTNLRYINIKILGRLASLGAFILHFLYYFAYSQHR